MIRDPLALIYSALKKKIKDVHGEKFYVTDGIPSVSEYKKQLPAANISYVSGAAEKAFMREYEPHKLVNNGDGTYMAIYEIMRFSYLIQISFFAKMPGIAQQLSLIFIDVLESNNLLCLDDTWDSDTNIFLQSPPLPARGEEFLYQVDQTWVCSGKLLHQELVNEIDLKDLYLKIKNMEVEKQCQC